MTALLLAGCDGFSFERPSEVHDLRILAIVASPPELTGGDAPWVVVYALAVDTPLNVARVVEYSWASCVPPASRRPGASGPDFASSSVERCPEQTDGGLLLTDTGVLVGGLPGEVPAPPETNAALHDLPLVGAPQMQVQLQLHLDGGEDLYAVKRIAVTPVLPPGQSRNSNPAIGRLTFDGQEWFQQAPPLLAFGDCPAAKKNPRCTHEIAPSFSPGQNQKYMGLDVLSNQIIEQTERLSFSWFTSAGSFDPEVTAQQDPRLTLFDQGLTTNWMEPEQKPTGDVIVWVVMRDDRGGATFTGRRIQFQ